MGVTVLKVKNGNEAMTGIVRTPSGTTFKNCNLRNITLDGNKANNAVGAGLVIGYFCGVSPGVAQTDEDIFC